MKDFLINMWKKISNTTSIMAITAEVIILLNVFGVKVDDKRINAGVLAVCTLFVIIGVFNDKGMRTTKFNK